MSGAKKSFGDNPALSYLGPVAGDAVRSGDGADYREAMRGVEPRSRQVHLMLRPSVYEKVKRVAAGRGVSVNDLIHSTLEALEE
jgi:hypothetical protein